MRPAHLHLNDFTGPPSTSLGWWSLLLEIAFLLALGATAAWLAVGPQGPGATLGAPELLAVAVTVTAGIAMAVTAALAIFRKGERSFHDVLSLLLGGMVLLILARQLV